MIKKILFLMLLIIGTSNYAMADAWTDCGQRLISSGKVAEFVRKIVSTNPSDPAAALSTKADDIRLLLLAEMFSDDTGLCKREIVDIAKMETLGLAFDIGNTQYVFDINVDKLFDYFPTQTTIFVYNNPTKRQWETVANDSIKSEYWNKDCSRLWISGNPSVGKGEVSKAGSATLPYQDGDMFFLDFVKGNNQRAFPGIMIVDKNWSTNEGIVLFRHLPTAIKMTKSFAEKLQNSACSNQGLSVYLASVAGNPDKHNTSGNVNNTTTKGNWNAATGAGVGIGAVITGASYLTGTAIVAGAANAIVGAGVLQFAVAAGVSVPVAGWIVGGVIAGVAGVIALWPQNITKEIQQIYILDGPHTIR